MLVGEFSFVEIKQYDKDHGTIFIDRLKEVCGKYAKEGQAPGVFSQLGTDWTLHGAVYALRQTLRYVGFGYKSSMVFRDLGAVVSEIFAEMSSVGDNDSN